MKNCNDLVNQINEVIVDLAYLNEQEGVNICLKEHILKLQDIRKDVRNIQRGLMDIHGAILEVYK